MISTALLVLSPFVVAPGADDPCDTAWTILLYGAVDNDWEGQFMRDILEMRAGLAGVEGVEVVLLIDRSPRYSRNDSSLGEDFASTRLYRLTGGDVERIDGAPQMPHLTLDPESELDLGDAGTLKNFVRLGKERFPAKHTALWLVSHGEGMRFCPDETNGDAELFTAELTGVLTEDESVDMLGFDACLMGGVENAYEWRPAPGKFGADVLVAAPPVSSSWPYAEIFARLRTVGAEAAATLTRPALDPRTATAVELAGMIVEELWHQIGEGRSGDRGLERDLQAWGAFDLSAVAATKRRIDALAMRLWRDEEKADTLALRGAGLEAGTFVYVWPEPDADVDMPFVDLAHLCERIAASEAFGDEARALAEAALDSVDALVTHSVGFDHYAGFTPGRHGIYIVFPDGDRTTPQGTTYWERTAWYSPLRVEGESGAYGRYAWCIDDATPGDGQVDGWFELMDAWFDAADETGGHNGYRW